MWARGGSGTGRGEAPDRRAVLVTGGAGFVGSHACKALSRAGFLPVVYDNLSNGVRDAVRWGPLEVGDLEDEPRLAAVIESYRPVGVMHFAAFIEAGGSVREPERFYRNNVSGTLSLLKVMHAVGVRHLVFSSTAAVYGEPNAVPIDERHPLRPVNPYGRSKLMVEDVIADVSHATGLRYAALRYFNAAGADPDGELSENHDPETHLIPLALESVMGLRPEFVVYGEDYDTADGTCVRDFVHVSDLAAAHVAALGRLVEGGDSLVANLGSGAGFSVREVLDAVERTTGRRVPIRRGERRAGDPAVLVADPTLAREALDWRPRLSGLDRILRDAFAAMPRRTAILGGRESRESTRIVA